jgi:pyruvate/2-oxoglutarate dehydrogenase complex dihydrolipoamide dehydrogenase (E3) component
VSEQRVLVATGRRPRTEGLDLGEAGVATDDRGFIRVDGGQRTSNPRVFAAGDVAGAPQYVYVAAAGGRGRRPQRPGRRRCPRRGRLHGSAGRGVHPPPAGVGGPDRGAGDHGSRCDCRVLGLDDVPRALVEHDTRGALKLAADADTGRVLGVHALADGAGELMLAATYAIRAGMTVTTSPTPGRPISRWPRAFGSPPASSATSGPPSAAPEPPNRLSEEEYVTEHVDVAVIGLGPGGGYLTATEAPEP